MSKEIKKLARENCLPFSFVDFGPLPYLFNSQMPKSGYPAKATASIIPLPTHFQSLKIDNLCPDLL